MLISNKMKSQGFRGDVTFEVLSSGSPIATLNESKLTFDVGGTSYVVARQKGAFPVFELKSGDIILATAAQTPLFNKYALVYDGREWLFKAVGMLANKYGLFQNDRQLGTISAGGFLNKLKGISIDLPDDLPQCIQLFLLLIALRAWTDTAN
jgi:hypothetical protein